MSIDRWSRNEIALGMCPDGPFVQLSEYESLARQHREEVEAAEAATLRSQGQAVASGDVGREAWTIADRIEFALRDAGFTEADAAKYTTAALRSQGQAVEVEDAFNAGWRMAADWAERDDLLADMDSGAYKTERGAALAAHGKGGS